MEFVIMAKSTDITDGLWIMDSNPSNFLFIQVFPYKDYKTEKRFTKWSSTEWYNKNCRNDKIDDS